MEHQNNANFPLPHKATEHCCCNCGCSEHMCFKTGIQYAAIDTPIAVEPHVTIGEIETECFGEPEICCIESHCDKRCRILISQKIRIKIPIKYNTTACVGESSIDCDCNKSYSE